MQLKDELRSGLDKVGQCILPAQGASGLKSNGAGVSECRTIREPLSARGRLEARATLNCIVPANGPSNKQPPRRVGARGLQKTSGIALVL